MQCTVIYDVTFEITKETDKLAWSTYNEILLMEKNNIKKLGGNLPGGVHLERVFWGNSPGNIRPGITRGRVH